MLAHVGPTLRTMLRRPWSAAAIVGTLALGVGATTLVFTFVNGVLLRPLPFPEPERLVAIWSRFEKASGYTRDVYPVGSPEYFDYERQNRTMESVAGIGSTTVTLTAGSGDPELLSGATVTSSFFTTLRARAEIGRTLQPDDDPPNAPWAVVLSHGTWTRRFGSDPALIGRTIDLELGDQPGTVAAQVVGVMPAGFQFPRADTAMWLPLHLDPARTWRGGHWFSMIARLKPGVTVAGAAAEMATLMSRWAVEYPDHHSGHGLFLLPLLDDLVATAAPLLRLLTAVVGCVLLIATANVAGLLLAAGEVRRREFALRAALGGGRRRLFGQLLVESLALCLAGGALGVALAAVTLRSAVAITAERMPRLEMVRLDMTAAGFAVAVSVTVALLLAALQARRVGSGDLAGLLRSGGRGVAGSSVRLRRGLVVLEVALAVVLLACTGVLLRSVRTLVAQDLGVPTEGMVATRLVLPGGRYGDAGGAAFFASLETAVRAVPGVETTALVSNPPVSPGRGSMSRVRIKGREEVAVGEAQPVATAMTVGPDAMQNLGLRLLRGRLIDGGDGPGAPLVVVIDELMARRYWPGTDPLGQEIRFLRTEGPWHTVVGVVAPVRWDGLDAANPTFYSAYRQTPTWAPQMSGAMTLVVRARLGAAATADLVRAAVRDLDPLLPVRRIDSIATLTSQALGERRILLVLLTSFAGLALLLAAVGVFALQAFLVATTSGEIAVRLSLGATPRRVVAGVLGASGRLVLAGTVIGCLAAVGAGRFLSAYLYQVRPHDPWTLAAVAFVVGAAGLAASALPARRAASVDPAATLREE